MNEHELENLGSYRRERAEDYSESENRSYHEIILRFSISKFRDVARIVPFVKKRGSGKLSPEAIARRDVLNAKRHTDKTRQIGSLSSTKEVAGNIRHTATVRLENFIEGVSMLDAIPLVPERPHPDRPWDDEPSIDEPYIPSDPGEVPDEDSFEGYP